MKLKNILTGLAAVYAFVCILRALDIAPLDLQLAFEATDDLSAGT